MVAVRLTWSEVYLAAIAGCRRRVNGLRLERSEPYGTPSDTWGADVESVAAEVAACKALGAYWPGAGLELDREEGDFRYAGMTCQVRHTTHANGRLLVYQDDSDAHTFFLVAGRAPEFVVCGFLFGHEAKDGRWWDESFRTACYAVPQSELRPCDALTEAAA